MKKCYYELLQVDSCATLDEIKKAYKKQVRLISLILKIRL